MTTNGFSRRGMVLFYAATTFISAFLLFQVQPIISKAILPWFGGSPAVWTTAMLFFQTLLFAGYAYAHFTQSLRPSAQAILHVALLVAAVAVYPILPGPNWKPPDGLEPATRILLLLSASVGIPYFVLSATGPLVQAWFARDYPGRSPYRLYSLSNVGSLLALLTYPFLIEPAFALSSQALYWEIGFVVFGLFCGFLAVRAGIIGQRVPTGAGMQSSKETGAAQGEVGGLAVAAPEPRSNANNPYQPPLAATANVATTIAATTADATSAAEASPGWGRGLLWLVLPAFASLTFLATTNHVCQDVAVIPFLWIAPLSLYLLSFIICFDHERWYIPRLYAAATLLVFLAGGFWATRSAWMHYVKLDSGDYDKIQFDAALSFAGMFLVCMLCHGELVRLRPHPRHLTMFYLLIAAGGAVGGLFVSLVAPMIFTGYTEWAIALLGGCLLAVAIIVGTEDKGFLRQYPWIFVPGLMLFAGGLYWGAETGLGADSNVIVAKRNFYGVVSVTDESALFRGQPEKTRVLINGRIRHGMQFVEETLRDEPTTYYGRDSGVGLAIDYFGTLPSERVGAIGLGTGTLAAYATKNDHFVFYEINPQVPELANEYFTFLGDARERMTHGNGRLDIVMGDARLSLDRELGSESSRHGFHVLVVDAFSGDAIPTHLLTREAGDIYRRQLDPQGVLAIHISNRYLDLDPVVRGLADYLGFKVLRIDSAGDNNVGTSTADWMLLTRNEGLLAKLSSASKKPPAEPRSLLWTDEYSDLWRILK